MTMMTTEKPTIRRAVERRAVRFTTARRAVVPASPAPPIAHPFSHSEGRTRCPACELREYLDG
jgi:hypothetical protein